MCSHYTVVHSRAPSIIQQVSILSRLLFPGQNQTQNRFAVWTLIIIQGEYPADANDLSMIRRWFGGQARKYWRERKRSFRRENEQHFNEFQIQYGRLDNLVNSRIRQTPLTMEFRRKRIVTFWKRLSVGSSDPKINRLSLKLAKEIWVILVCRW